MSTNSSATSASSSPAPTSARPTIGIDLGTTNSVVARVNEARHTEMVTGRMGEMLVPSIVLFEEDRVYVGEEARLRGRAHPERLISCIKSRLGENLPAPPVAGVTLPIEVIQGCILNKLRSELAPRIDANCGVVIAVPAFFGDPQRKATADAGQLAGLDVLDVVNEPVAAALAFSEHSGYLSPAASPLQRMYLLVYDLGGFSFEVTLLEVESGDLKMLGTRHDLHLGGHDWDFRIADYLAGEFARQHGDDPRRDPAGLEHLLQRAERAKMALSLRKSVHVTVEHAGHSKAVTLTREKFAELTSDLVRRTTDMAAELLEQSGLKWADVSRVLLVGGATRMPVVRQALWQLSGQQPDSTVHPEEAVARGAAIYAHQLEAMSTATGRRPHFRVTSVASHSLGIEGVDSRTGQKTHTVLIPRGTALPAKASRKFVTRANAQKAITIVVLEGDSKDPQRCVTIGRATLRDLPAELSEEWPIDVSFEYTISGRLKVDVQVRYTDRMVHLEMVRSSGMTLDQVRGWRQLVTSGAGLAAMRGLLQQERPRPIALASSGAESDAGQDEAAHGISALAARYATYAMRFLGWTRTEPVPTAAAGHRELDPAHPPGKEAP